jgi:hypothetical protein
MSTSGINFFPVSTRPGLFQYLLRFSGYTRVSFLKVSRGLYNQILDDTKDALDSWTVGTDCGSRTYEGCKDIQWPVKYCLSEPGPPYCKLNYGTEIAIIVTCLNFCKLLVPVIICSPTKSFACGKKSLEYSSESRSQLNLFNTFHIQTNT